MKIGLKNSLFGKWFLPHFSTHSQSLTTSRFLRFEARLLSHLTSAPTPSFHDSVLFFLRWTSQTPFIPLQGPRPNPLKTWDVILFLCRFLTLVLLLEPRAWSCRFNWKLVYIRHSPGCLGSHTHVVFTHDKTSHICVHLFISASYWINSVFFMLRSQSFCCTPNSGEFSFRFSSQT
jgi:hypothetical protein